MSDKPKGAADRLAEARRLGDPDALAEALVRHANEQLSNGRTEAARQELDEAASIYRARGQAYDEARCLQLAATLCRFEGRLDKARQRATATLALAGTLASIAASAQTELGEIALAERNGAAAVAAFGSALDVAGPDDPARASVLRRRATAFILTGKLEEAVRDLDRSAELLAGQGDRASSAQALIEAATALQNGGLAHDAGRFIDRAMGIAAPAEDRAALADLYLLLATREVGRGDIAGAMRSVQMARTHALAARASAPYIGAAVALAQLADQAGDRVAAYGSLAAGWVTLADLVGGDLAKMAFAPRLTELRERWGAAAFDAAKEAYEASSQAKR
jgi:tetratricopeptide (TPR) repeat protein